jgi:hypothetical protein
VACAVPGKVKVKLWQREPPADLISRSLPRSTDGWLLVVCALGGVLKSCALCDGLKLACSQPSGVVCGAGARPELRR